MVSFNAIFIVDIVFEYSGKSISIKVRNSEVGTRAFATDASKSEILTQGQELYAMRSQSLSVVACDQRKQVQSVLMVGK